MFQITEDHIQQIIDEAKDLRGYLHEHPELSNQEYATSKLLKGKCRALGLEVRETENTGFIAILDTGRPGKTLGMRADMDALPIHENPMNLKQDKAWVSKTDNVMHACGHDGHMAIMMAVIRLLVENQYQLQGKLVFIFEEAEENNTGIHIMVDFLKDQGIEFDAIYGNHVASFVDTGKVVIKEGPVMAAQRAFELTVKGKSGHGSRPDLAVNPIFAGAQILAALTNAWANQVDVTQTVTLGVAQFHSGEAFNVIPATATLGGSLRYFDREAGEAAFEILKEVARHTAKAHKTQLEINERPDRFLDVIVNDPDLTQLAKEALTELYPDAAVSEPSWFASETFFGYRQFAPCFFALVGIRNPELGSGAEHHNEHFDFDNEALQYGIGLTANFAVKFLNQEN